MDLKEQMKRNEHPLSETLKVAAARSQWWWGQPWWPYFSGVILKAFGFPVSLGFWLGFDLGLPIDSLLF